MYNAAISPLAASAGVDNAELLIEPLTQKLFFALLQENYSILRHAGVTLEQIGPFHPDTVHAYIANPVFAQTHGTIFPTIVARNLLFYESGYGKRTD